MHAWIHVVKLNVMFELKYINVVCEQRTYVAKQLQNNLEMKINTYMYSFKHIY